MGRVKVGKKKSKKYVNVTDSGNQGDPFYIFSEGGREMNGDAQQRPGF